MTDTGRAERIARNEARFRELNTQLEQGLGQIDREPGERAAFVCECARPDCAELVKLPLEEYRAAHADDRHFVVVPGHEFPDVERVVEVHAGHALIEKLDVGQVQDVVERDDD